MPMVKLSSGNHMNILMRGNIKKHLKRFRIQNNNSKRKLLIVETFNFKTKNTVARSVKNNC